MDRAPSHAAPIPLATRGAPAVFERLADIFSTIEAGQGSAEAVLELLVQLLLHTTSCLHAVAFDLRQTGQARFEIRQIASSPGADPDRESLARLASDPVFRAGLSGLVDSGRQNAFRSPAEARYGQNLPALPTLCIRLGDESKVDGGCIAWFPSQPGYDDTAAAEALSRLGGVLLRALREKQFSQGSTEDGGAFRERMSEVLALAADVYWEADDKGIVRHVVSLREGEKSRQILRSLQGKALAALLRAPNSASRRDAASPSESFRERRCVVQEIGRPEMILDLSGHRSRDSNIWCGIARLADASRESHFADRQVRAVIEKLEEARDREEALRRETEVILDGLRILTNSQVNADVFAALLIHLAPAMEFHDAVILQKEWSGRITACAATSPELRSLSWQNAADEFFASEDVAALCDPPAGLAAQCNREWASALMTRLRGGARPAILLCLHRARDFFSTRHLGLGTRLSLVASQAFVNEEERQKVLQASKLATVGEMAAGIVHEINQPLSAMTLAVENLKAMIDADTFNHDTLHTKLDRLKEQIGRITKIVASMRSLTRRSEGLAESFAVSSAIADAWTIVRHRLDQNAIELIVDVPEGHRIDGNQLEFTQVILNLLSNASDAIESHVSKTTNTEEAARRITVTADQPDAEWLTLSVRDTGPGFPESTLDKALEPFFTTKDLGKGTGLGLALSQRIIEGMGGEIIVGNWEKGAEICLRLRISGTRGDIGVSAAE